MEPGPCYVGLMLSAPPFTSLLPRSTTRRRRAKVNGERSEPEPSGETGEHSRGTVGTEGGVAWLPLHSLTSVLSPHSSAQGPVPSGPAVRIIYS